MTLFDGYEEFMGDPHALVGLAKEEIEKIYKDSCINAIKKIRLKNQERVKQIQDSSKRGKELMQAYDKDDRELVEDILWKLKKLT